MKALLKFSFLLIFLLGNISTLMSQCASINFYRKNSLQSDKVLYLFNGSEQIATVALGDRYVATVCSEGRYEFVVKNDADGISLYKTALNVQPGQEYFVKVSCMFGSDIPAIKKMDTGKGKKDWSKKSKFLGSIEQLIIGKAAIASTNDNTNYGGGQQTGAGFKKVQIIDNFKFDLVKVSRAGKQVTFNYKITNLASEDRWLAICQVNSYFYDANGTSIFISKACVGSACGGYPYSSKNGSPPSIGPPFSGAYAPKNLVPSRIPINAVVIMNYVPRETKSFVRAAIAIKGDRDFYLEYSHIEFPNVVDPLNPLKRNFNDQSIELLSFRKQNNGVVLKYRFTNKTEVAVNLGITGATTYDNQGQDHQLGGVAFVDANLRDNYYYNWNKTVNSGQSVDFYLFVDNIPAVINKLSRVTLYLGEFSLNWEDIALQNSSSINTTSSENSKANGFSNNGTNKDSYLDFQEWETKLSNNENAVGSKVILENIYFAFGKDEILEKSFPQMLELTKILKNNPQVKLRVIGHTDNIGGETENMLLSQKRADAVRYYLISQEIDPARTSSIGKGESMPLFNNDTEGGRKINRRVEIEIVE